MRKLIDIIEGLKINSKTKVNKYSSYKPKNKRELKNIIRERLKNNKDADLNDLDVSEITDMGSLFYELDPHNIDISEWNVSNVTNMRDMFGNCINFNSNLSNWDVSNVRNMGWMFNDCENFNCNISDWNVSKVNLMSFMFYGCKNFDCDLNKWDVSGIVDSGMMKWMFYNTKLSSEDKLPSWYKLV